jgi:hypothetical protein
MQCADGNGKAGAAGKGGSGAKAGRKGGRGAKAGGACAKDKEGGAGAEDTEMVQVLRAELAAVRAKRGRKERHGGLQNKKRQET